MKALIAADGRTVQHNDVEYAEEAVSSRTGEHGVAIQYIHGETKFVSDGHIIGIYTEAVWEPEIHVIDEVRN